MTHKATVITHSGDPEGDLCREIARKFLGSEGVAFVGWDYSQPKVSFPEEGVVYVIGLPLPFDKALTPTQEERVIWIDRQCGILQNADA